MKYLHLMVALPGRLEQIESIAAEAAPSLLKLLRRGHASRPMAGYAASLCQAFGIDAQQDWPMAPICAAAEGLDADGYWLRLDPAHLEVGMGGLLMQPPDSLNLSMAEAQALITDINRQWQDEHLAIQAASPTRWYLHLDETPILHTTPIDQVIGEYLTPALPRGTDARRFMKLINEMQMLMHSHPVNLARESAGQLAVNGLWLWGGGRLPAGKPTFDRVATDDFGAQALARLAGCPVVRAPVSWSELNLSGRVLVARPSPGTAEQYDSQASDLQTTLARLEENWFRPALRQLIWGRIQRMRLELIGQNITDLNPVRCWRLWR